MPTPKDKTYSIKQSPLYKLCNRAKLSKLLGISPTELKHLSEETNYRSFKKGSKTIYYPKQKLKSVQKRFLALLRRIKTPEWLFSGKKGVSYIDNAKAHLENIYMVKLDIRSFYESCKSEYVFRFFKYKLEQVDDVAWLCADLVTYNTFIPRGSPTSQLIAFWSHSDLFEKINQISRRYNCDMSLYVDDMSFSSNNQIDKKIILEINTELKKENLCIKRKKTKNYSKDQYKIITGCIITPQGKLAVPNKLRHKIHNILKTKTKDKKTINKTAGLINSAKEIDPNFMKTV